MTKQVKTNPKASGVSFRYGIMPPDKFLEVTADGKQEIEEGKEPLNKPSEYPVAAAQSNYQDAQNEEDNKKKAKKLNKADSIKGGYADKSNPSDFDKTQLEMGIKVEMEHTKDKSKAREIAMDHLKEIPDYYDRLKIMESRAKSNMNKSINERWELIKKDLKHNSAFMDISIEDGEKKDNDSDSDKKIPEDELRELIAAHSDSSPEQEPGPNEDVDGNNKIDGDELQDEDGDGILEGKLEGKTPPPKPEDMEEGGTDVPPDGTMEERIEKLPPEEIERMMTEMGYSKEEIAHVIHGHIIPPQDEKAVAKESRDNEKHQHEIQLKQHEIAIKEAEARLAQDHGKKMNEAESNKTTKLHDVEIEHEKRMKDLEYDITRREKELELKYKERELESKLKHKEEHNKKKLSEANDKD